MSLAADEALTLELNNETAKINWAELQRFFAAGVAIKVSPTLDLIAVAKHFATDNKEAVEDLLKTADVAKVSDAEALTWHTDNATLWAVVVKPWVLVQPITTANNSSYPE